MSRDARKFLIGQIPLAVAGALCISGGLSSLLQVRWFDGLICFFAFFLTFYLNFRWMLHCLGMTREEWLEISD